MVALNSPNTLTKFLATVIFILFYLGLFSLAANVGAYQEAKNYGSKERASFLSSGAAISIIILVIIVGYALVKYFSKEDESCHH